ncbi:MAG: orotidine-5'-phosphate decarboxylase [Chromatiales bacterium]|jgi:orotidine-5'-phosphate decarboxylase|nr:orotidine-5'-phosphate decarboxylase [Chromatiales bacterium]
MELKVIEPSIIVALDYPDAASALAMARQLDPTSCRVKVGKELFTRAGPAIVESLRGLGFEVFLDLKFHDIPNTVAGACRAAADLGVWMLNVHACGGVQMLEAAREAVGTGRDAPLLIAVTVLTSLDDNNLRSVGITHDVRTQVACLTSLAVSSGCDGVVCSPHEISLLRPDHPAPFRLVTPGVRPAGMATADQKRTMTPGEAAAAGVSDLVIGRPVTAAADPLAALQAIRTELVQPAA